MKKGFTLIELLAVIVILAVILLVVMPIVLNVINQARKGAFQSSVYGYLKTAENAYAKDILNNQVEAKLYQFENSVQTEGDILEFSGIKPRNGYIYVFEDGRVAIVLEDGLWLAIKAPDEKEMTIEELDNQNLESIFNTLIGTTYTVTYDANEGECTPASREVIYGNTASAPSCTREGYLITNFARTVGGEVGELNVDTGEVTNVTGNQTIRVNWESAWSCGQAISWQGVNYETVQIGTQCWFAENLRATHNGCLANAWLWASPYNACRVSGGIGWNQYEVHYQWGAAMNGDGEGGQGLCPTGWKIPTDGEWTTLTNFVGTDPGQKLKSTDPSWNGTNTVGFNAKPVGYRDSAGGLFNVGVTGNFWTSTPSAANAWRRSLTSADTTVSATLNSQVHGWSVRCLLGS